MLSPAAAPSRLTCKPAQLLEVSPVTATYQRNDNINYIIIVDIVLHVVEEEAIHKRLVLV